jgi:crotonobetainyl-CoA:carnitine CoA-transferase CaiB-like acyl-CoA transferase
MLPLAGIRIVDLGSVLMAPYATQWLGDLGAEIIKVESSAGDSVRNTGPATEPGMAGLFLYVNRNKRSIVLDIQDSRGQAALLKLIAGADVFVHNIRPQKLAKIGLDPDALLALNPRLVVAGMYGFAKDGPYGGRPAYDDIIQGMSGLVDLVERQTGQPRYMPVVNADKTTGLVGALSILAAIVARQTTGKGSVIEIPMFETMVAFNMVEHLYGATFDPPIGGTGYPRPLAADRGPYRSLDGVISLMPYTDKHWRDFFRSLPTPELADDPRFATIITRTQNIDALYGVISAAVREKPNAYWMRLCDELQIPAAPVLTLDQLLDDPHLAETGFYHRATDSKIGDFRLPGVPVTFDGARPQPTIAPRLGQHTREILAEAGLAADEISALIAAGVAREPNTDENAA